MMERIAGAAPAWLWRDGDYVAVRVVVRPGSTRRGIIRAEPCGIVVGVNAPPEKGRANAELAELFAAMLRTPKSAVTIARGETARVKTIRIATRTPGAMMSVLMAAAAQT